MSAPRSVGERYFLEACEFDASQPDAPDSRKRKRVSAVSTLRRYFAENWNCCCAIYKFT
jgi:hypothetical protein